MQASIAQQQEQIANLRSELVVKSSRAKKADTQLAAACREIEALRELNDLMLRATRFEARSLGPRSAAQTRPPFITPVASQKAGTMTARQL